MSIVSHKKCGLKRLSCTSVTWKIVFIHFAPLHNSELKPPRRGSNDRIIDNIILAPRLLRYILIIILRARVPRYLILLSILFDDCLRGRNLGRISLFFILLLKQFILLSDFLLQSFNCLNQLILVSALEPWVPNITTTWLDFLLLYYLTCIYWWWGTADRVKLNLASVVIPVHYKYNIY